MDTKDLPDDVPRRSFFMRAATAVVAAVVGIIPAAAAGGFLLGPLLRRQGEAGGGQAGDGFLPVGIGMTALPADGTPQSFTVRADRIDSWNFHAQQPIGKVWLRRMPNDQVLAFNRICPHLGCDVDFRSAQGDFYCPCHASTFLLDGERQNRIPPRNMDSLETRIVDGQIEVKFQDFRGAIPEKVPV